MHFDISYSRLTAVTLHCNETGLQMQKVVALYIHFTNCNTLLGISEYTIYI